MADFAFIPTDEQKNQSNIFNFMKRNNISSMEELSKKSIQDPEWFWREVDRDIGIVWNKPYQRILDISKGIPWS
ncbi:MAG: AMP-dependent synthetase, partial [Nitrosarchaeum sp.]|nr:AMP-dependent synthetase [Nitrosarchaeum sp.]